MPDLHVLTGGKGGVGKTLCALCATLHFLSEKQRVVLVDLNYHNNDVAELLRHFTQSERNRPLGDTGFKIVPFRGVDFPGEESFLVYPDPDGKVFGRLPYEGGLGMYRGLHEVLITMNERMPEHDSYIPDACVVDTGMHLSNLHPFTPLERGSEIISRQLGFLTDFRLSIWFVWTIAILRREYEANAIDRTLRELGQIHDRNRQKWFDDTASLIHVLNFNAFSPKEKIFNWKPVDEYCHEELLKLSQADIANSLGFRQFYRKARNVVVNSIQNRPAYLGGIARSIGRNDGTARDEPWNRPRNVFPIPYYNRGLAAYVDALPQLIGDEVLEVEDLKKQVGKIYMTLSRFLRNI